MVKIENGQVYSTTGKMIRRKGSDACFKRGTVLAADTVDGFDEVEEVPAYTKDEYDAMVARLVRERYTADEEFALQRKAINATFSPSSLSEGRDNNAMEEYADYNAYVEECKRKAKSPGLYENPNPQLPDE